MKLKDFPQVIEFTCDQVPDETLVFENRYCLVNFNKDNVVVTQGGGLNKFGLNKFENKFDLRVARNKRVKAFPDLFPASVFVCTGVGLYKIAKSKISTVLVGDTPINDFVIMNIANHPVVFYTQENHIVRNVYNGKCKSDKVCVFKPAKSVVVEMTQKFFGGDTYQEHMDFVECILQLHSKGNKLFAVSQKSVAVLDSDLGISRIVPVNQDFIVGEVYSSLLDYLYVSSRKSGYVHFLNLEDGKMGVCSLFQTPTKLKFLGNGWVNYTDQSNRIIAEKLKTKNTQVQEYYFLRSEKEIVAIFFSNNFCFWVY